MCPSKAFLCKSIKVILVYVILVPVPLQWSKLTALYEVGFHLYLFMPHLFIYGVNITSLYWFWCHIHSAFSKTYTVSSFPKTLCLLFMESEQVCALEWELEPVCPKAGAVISRLNVYPLIEQR